MGGRGNTHRFTLVYHGGAGVTVDRQDMGESKGGSTAGSGGKAVGNDLHVGTAGNRGTVGGVTAAI